MATTATKKSAAPATKKAAPASKKAAAPVAKKAAAPAVKKSVAAAPLKPITDLFKKASLTIHLGAKEFTLPALLKVVAQDVPAKKKRFGKDPFSGEDKWFAAKPASVRLKSVR